MRLRTIVTALAGSIVLACSKAPPPPVPSTAAAPAPLHFSQFPPSGSVLHVGTGQPRWMVVSAETCDGLRAYLGVVSSYYQRIDEERLTDEKWQSLVATTPDVPWARDLLAAAAVITP